MNYEIIQSERVLTCDSKIKLQQYDNLVDNISFTLDSNMQTYIYAILKNTRTNDIVKVQLDENNAIDITQDITKMSGIFEIELVSSSVEIVDGILDESATTYSTDKYSLIIVYPSNLEVTG